MPDNGEILPQAIAALPESVREGVSDRWAGFEEDQPDHAMEIHGCPVVAASLPRVWACSKFVQTACTNHPEDLSFLTGKNGVQAPWTEGTLEADLRERIAECADEAEAMRCLRVFRRRQAVKAAWRDLADLSSLDEILGHMSDLADVSIRSAVDFSHRRLAAIHGEPRDSEGHPQSLIVLGMGKLGGRELNFSSDIDLVFLYQEAGMTDGERPIGNEQFFLKLGQGVIRMLDKVTEDGFVFRVDMRLRPFGDSGPLVVSMAAFEIYLQQHGRAWERYAFIKARPITGHRAGMGLFRNILRPFVYRRYLDYGIFETLREMKQMIEVEAEQEQLLGDIKRGRGGIREIEFIAQCFQLLRGGNDATLRDTALQDVLPRLAMTRQITTRVVDDLLSAYRFLRTVENRLQEWRDRQTHALPDDQAGRERLAFATGFGDWQSLAPEIERQRDCVNRIFTEQVIGVEADEAGVGNESLRALWEGRLEADVGLQLLKSRGFGDPARARTVLRSLASASFVRRLDQAGRSRLNLVVPAVIEEAARHRDPEQVLERLAAVIESVGLRSAYLALLKENRTALSRLAELCGRSGFLARQVADHPLLLDELIDPRVFDQLPDRVALAAALDEHLSGVPDDELEAQMDALRRFQRSAVFLVAVADLGGSLPLMKVSDQLTGIAEVVLESCIAMAKRDMRRRHGTPQSCSGEEIGFAVVAYGKLGGIELGYGSDLDLVFVHDSEAEGETVGGEKPLATSHFFTRLSRRVVHLLSTQTSSGHLYEVDTRLKPSGKGGLLVTSLRAFGDYQRERAWTWEHQALLRARAVAGDESARASFESIRRDILCSCIRRSTLGEEVARMREKMFSELRDGGNGVFDIKRSKGGLTDIEFLVQYLVLRDAAEHPRLIEFSDIIRQLEALVREQLLPADDAEALRRIWLEYRNCIHHLALERQAGKVDADRFRQEREIVTAFWNQHFDGS